MRFGAAGRNELTSSTRHRDAEYFETLEFDSSRADVTERDDEMRRRSVIDERVAKTMWPG